MRLETEMLFSHIVKENRSLREIVDPGYTFLNQKLIEYYGLKDLPGMVEIRGDEMRKVELPADSWRGGILTHGSMLLITSNPTRTSPVKRGLFVLENLLGTPTPPAPPNVPELEDSADRFGGREPSLRELLAVHRESSCAHRVMLEWIHSVWPWRITTHWPCFEQLNRSSRSMPLGS